MAFLGEKWNSLRDFFRKDTPREELRKKITNKIPESEYQKNFEAHLAIAEELIAELNEEFGELGLFSVVPLTNQVRIDFDGKRVLYIETMYVLVYSKKELESLINKAIK